MINRYSLTASASLLAERFAVEVGAAYTPRYNAAPTHLLPVITSSAPQGLSWFYWGRPQAYARNKPLGEKIVNLPAETFHDKPILKHALLKRRCIVPADGWYGWKKIGKKITVPYRITLVDQPLASFAGVWEEFEDENGEMVHTFIVITVKSNKLLDSFDERMPALLTKTAEDVWLNQFSDEAELLETLQPFPETLLGLYTVSPRINDITNNHASLILPAPAADQHGNLTLFD